MQVIVLTLLSCLLVACNGASGENGSDPFNPDNSATASVKIGHFNAQGQFVEGQMGVSLERQNGAVIISAGGSVGLNLALVDDDDQAISDTVAVSFSSVCVDNLQASMDKELSLKNGQASTTFTDISCAGASGTREVISASVSISGETLRVSQEIDIQAEALGSISFSSAVPESIVLIGNGAQNTSTLSVLTFQVNGALGNPLSGQLVEFSLSTSIGGLSLLSDSGFTGANGQVSTQVSAGNVPTSVRVTASTQGANGELMQSQSNLLIVSTGLGDQDSFSLAADILNPEADNVDGQQVTLTARLADTFNNPVVNGTAISFTTEGGVIQPSCTTVDGACSVIWTSASPRVSDHRITILATAIGHETLYDSNGNNSFDDVDGGAILDGKDNGLEHGTFEQSGFVDHSEAWRDDDEDGQRDPAEIFLDYNNNQQFDQADGLFNGPQCLSATLCGEGIARSQHIRKSAVLIMSSSYANMDLLTLDGDLVFSNYQTVAQPNLSLNRGEKLNLVVRYTDTALQALPSGTDVAITTNAGLLEGSLADVIPNTTNPAARELAFSLSNDLAAEDSSSIAELAATITSPRGAISVLSIKVTLN